MKSKKANMGIWIGAIFLILIVIGVIVVLIIAFQKGNIFPQEVESKINPMKLYLQAFDENLEDSNNPVFLDANYEIYSNKTFISKGNLSKDSLTEIEVPRGIVEIYSYNKDYYLVKGYKMFSPSELMKNSSRMNIPLKKVGNLEISHTGNLQYIENLIRFNITSIDNWHKLSVAISWSPGIIDVYQKGGETIFCNKGIWKNYTAYDVNTKTYTWTPLTYYVCGQCQNTVCEISERCSKVEGNKCTPFSTLTPNRFIGKVDKVIYFGKNLKDKESYITEFYVKTLENKNALDFVEFTFYDQDKRFDQVENLWRYMSEQNGINLGAEDLVYKINYGE